MSFDSARSSFDSLPAYEKVMKAKDVQVAEKSLEYQPSSNPSSKWHTFKSIVTGDVHQHNAHYALERAVMSQQTSKPKSKPSSTSSPSKSNSTIRSISSADVHKHNPPYVLERAVMSRNTTKPKSEPSKLRSTLRSIAAGDVHSHHMLYRPEDSLTRKY